MAEVMKIQGKVLRAKARSRPVNSVSQDLWVSGYQNQRDGYPRWIIHQQ